VHPCLSSYLGRGIRTEGYRTTESARDVCSLLDLLGEDQVELHGVSYGTLLAQEVMRSCPERLRSVWLDAVLPADEVWSTRLGPNFQEALDRTFVACGAQADCKRAYPDPAAVWSALLDAPPEGLYPFFGAADLAEYLFGGLYDPTFAAAVPGLLYAIRDGRFFEYLDAFYQSVPFLPLGYTPIYLGSDFAAGLNFAMSCNDDLQYLDLEEVAAQSAALHPVLAEHFSSMLAAQRQECVRWSRGPKEPKSLVTVEVPALVTSGGFDPITPARGAERVARALPKAQYVNFSHLSHGLLIGEGCGYELYREFLADPERPLDTSWARDARVEFFVEAR
jgi:pimeloyl-ACP methyl ester carboxylesterase